MLIFNSIKARVSECFPVCLKLQLKLQFPHKVEQRVANGFVVMRSNGSSEMLYLAGTGALSSGNGKVCGGMHWEILQKPFTCPE